jgi:mono/diheme cytochrome c family protein
MKARVLSLALLAVVAGSASRLAAQAAGDAKTVYEDNCRKCHGVRGVPPKTMKEKFPKIATFDSAFIAAHSADSIVKVLTKGKNEDMKSFKDKMSAEQMLDVAKYVRELGSKNHP